MNAFKKQCIELRKRDYTLPEIMKVTGRSKTSVYFHIRDIPLSSKKKKQIAKATGERALQVALSRKGKSTRNFKPYSNWNSQKVLLLAHLMFDGRISHHSCGYYNRSSALITRVKKLMTLVYQYEPTQKIKQGSDVVEIAYHNVSLAAYLKAESKQLLKTINTLPLECKREFLRAFFDDEGCMDYRPAKNHRSIRGYQNNIKILKTVQKLLKDFDISSQLKGSNEVAVTGRGNLEKFKKEINFSKGIRLNPKRANSIWKKDIEKRELLDMAIKSFKT